MKYRIITAIAVATGLFASACNGPTPAKASNDPAATERLVVAIATARQHDMIRTAQGQGAVFRREKAVFADMGDQVKAGQMLARIDPREYQLRLDSAQEQLEQVRARLANARSKFER